MNKRVIWAGGVLFLIVGFSTMVNASNLNIFLEKCGSCHKEGAEAPPVEPADKAGLVWEKYFKRDRHPGNLHSSISAVELADVLTFLKNHAADSDHPVAAVIPK